MSALVPILLLALAAPEPAAPAKPAVIDPGIVLTARIVPERVLLGDSAMLEIVAKHPKTVRLFFPAKENISIKPFRVLEAPAAPDVSADGDLVVQTWRVPVTPLRVGRRKLPPFAIQYENTTAETGSVETPPIAVDVPPRVDLSAGVLPAPENDPPLPVFDKNWTLIILLIGLGVISVTAVITLVAVRYVAGLPRRGPPPPPPRPAHEVAAEKLAALAESKLLQLGKLKELTFRISEILREYLGLRYATETLELTSSELLERMKKLGPKGLSIYELETFLSGTDLVKFAKLTPSYGEAEGMVTTCERMVAQTRHTDVEVAAMLRSEERRRLSEKPAHPFKRTFAAFVDLLLFAAVSSAIVLVSRWYDMSWLLWVDGALFGLFLLFKDGYGPGSPGKVLTGLALTPESDLRSELLPLSARVARNVPLLLPIAGATMEFVVMAYAADGRRVGDRWARSRVLDRRPEASERTFLMYSVFVLAAVVLVASAPFWLSGGGAP